MVSRIVQVAPFDLVVFGGTGDLAHRKLFPALFHRFLDGQFSQPTKIIGVSRHDFDNSSYRASIAKALEAIRGRLLDRRSDQGLPRDDPLCRARHRQ